MRRLLVRDVNLLFALAVVVVMGFMAAAGWHRSVSTQRLRDATRNTSDESRLLDSIGQSLRDAERTQFDYLRGGGRPDLIAYQAATRRIDGLSVRLDQHAARDIDAEHGTDKTHPGASVPSLPGLMKLVGMRQAALAQEVALRDAGAPAATIIDMHKRRGMHQSAEVMDRLAATGQMLDRRRQSYLDTVTHTLQALRWLAACVASLGLAGVLSLLHLLARAWRRLLRAETEQRTTALQLRGSLDSLSQGVAVFGDDGCLLNWNLRLRQMLDLPTTLLRRGLPYDVLEHHLHAGDNAFLEPLATIRADAPGHGEARPVVYERVVPGRVATRQRPQGGETQVEIRRTLMPQGGFVLTLTDMTERVQAERMLGEAQKMQALGQLTGGIAHDFNNMLTVILGSLEVSPAEMEAAGGEGVGTAAMLAARMRQATQAAESGAALTRQLLAFARKQPLAPAPVAAGRILPQMIPLLRHSIGEAIEITFEAGAGLWPAMADAGQLESAVLNLALNARDAMPDGGSIAIEAHNVRFGPHQAAPHPDLAPGGGENGGEYVRISVADTGHGMSREVMAHAFEPFFSTKPEGHGTGLGLAMVFGFARQSGGTALIHSEPGRGTRITIYLPRASEQDVPVHPLPSAAMLQAAPPDAMRPPHILVVEDDASVRGITSEVLRELGYRVSEASDAEAALDGLDAQQGALDLLLTDVTLPGALDGRALAARVRQMQPSARILYMSGHLEAGSSADGDAEEASHWLGKPFRRAQLASKVGALVGGSPQGRAA